MDLSYILNSPDVERIASSLETIATDTTSAITGKVDKQQGSAAAGRALVVGSDGIVTLGEAGVPEAVANALLACFRKVAWVDTSGQTLYNALVAALDRTPEPEEWDIEWAYTDGMPEQNGFAYDGVQGASNLENDGLLLAVYSRYTPQNESACDTAICELVFTPKSFDATIANNEGFKYVVYKGGAIGCTLVVNHLGIMGYDNSLSSWKQFGQAAINVECKIRVECSAAKYMVYINDVYAGEGVPEQTGLTNNRIMQIGGGTTLLKSIKYRFEEG